MYTYRSRWWCLRLALLTSTGPWAAFCWSTRRLPTEIKFLSVLMINTVVNIPAKDLSIKTMATCCQDSCLEELHGCYISCRSLRTRWVVLWLEIDNNQINTALFVVTSPLSHTHTHTHTHTHSCKVLGDTRLRRAHKKQIKPWWIRESAAEVG